MKPDVPGRATLSSARRADRTSWILQQRPARQVMLDPRKPHGFFHETERDERGEISGVDTILLTNRECPFRCLMCDLWQQTLESSVAPGDIPAQIEFAFDAFANRHPQNTTLKLYNSGSFFDPRAIPKSDDPVIAKLVTPYRRLIVESHPRFLGERCLRFRDQLVQPLEVAIGLETVHPEALAALNKEMTLDDFTKAAQWLAQSQIALRCFVLVGVPLLSPAESVDWAVRSVAAAFDHGATAVSLIPLRSGNGAIDALLATGDAPRITLNELESAHEQALALRRGRVFADTWDLARFSACPACREARRQRIERMNLQQQTEPRIRCPVCSS